ncbi:MAG: hypothetical protein PHG16_13635 [Lachnospiraceae bacterium]|nr:hypothetical protein [Lachnospiraceae bacterium]
MRCPNCFSEIGNSSGSCPCCGYDLGTANTRTAFVNHGTYVPGWNKNYAYPEQIRQDTYEKPSYKFAIGIGILSGILTFHMLLIILLLIIGLR